MIAKRQWTKEATNKPQFVAGVDVGGTSIKTPILYPIVDGELDKKGIAVELSENNTTERGKTKHLAQMKSVFSDITKAAKDHGGELMAIGVGSPGRFDADSHRIKKGTNPNISGKTAEESLDGEVLADAYHQAITTDSKVSDSLKQVPIIVDNDAKFALDGVIHHIMHKTSPKVKSTTNRLLRKDALQNKHVAILTLGTGVGHSISHVIGGTHTVVTDGHASKILLSIDKEDQPIFRHANSELDEQQQIEGRTNLARAEDLFKSPTFNAIVSATQKPMGQVGALDTAIRITGKYMARTIAAIAEQNITDIEPENEWSPKDKADAAKTDIYIIAGGLGQSKDGLAMIRRAQSELNTLAEQHEESKPALAEKLRSIALYQYTGPEIAEHAAATAALTSLQQSQGRNL